MYVYMRVSRLGIFWDHHEQDPARRYKAFGRFQKASEGSVTLTTAAQLRELASRLEPLQVPPWQSNLRLSSDMASLGLRRGDLVFEPSREGRWAPQLQLGELRRRGVPTALGPCHTRWNHCWFTGWPTVSCLRLARGCLSTDA